MNVSIKGYSLNPMVRFILDIATMFCFMFEFRIGMGLTTRRLAVLFAMVYVSCHIRKFRKKVRVVPQKVILVSVLMLLSVLVIVASNKVIYAEDTTNTNMNIRYILYILLYVFFFAMYCLTRFDNLMNFCKVYLGVMYIQACSVFLSALNVNIRVFLYNKTLADQYKEDMILAVRAGSRICGIQLMASAGSLMLCTGCILLVYLVINKYLKNYQFIILFAVLASATMLVGRTGFYLEVILFMIYFLMYRNRNKYVSIVIVAIMAGMILLYLTTRLDAWIVTYYKKWIGEIFYSDRFKQTLEWIGATNVPKFSSEMIFGTNVLKGILPTGAIMSADSGYARMYCAIGVVGCILYYGAFLITYLGIAWGIKNKRNKLYYWFCVALSFIVEYKEPFFMKYFFPFIVLALGIFILMENEKDENMFSYRSTVRRWR